MTKTDGKVETTSYVHGLGIDEPLALVNRKGTYYYHADGLGSIIALTDERGKIIQEYQYDSFGNMRHRGNKVKQPYSYTAREYDKETGLYYYRARYYDPEIGRFTSEDPLTGLLQIPQTLNPYLYVVNNPVNFVDPEGEMSLSLIGGIIITGYSIAVVVVFEDCMERCTSTKLPRDPSCPPPPNAAQCAGLCIKYALLLGFGADPFGSTATTIGSEIGKSIVK